ncbi:hypothetical protein A1Q1_08043 [Trichosporon asahii var. asahii CBS 2479]|uniref:Chromatin-remodeling ATPase INO80 n=1 Tax=Trichosporon asahii var. asahii (strain ATCC 90039 / CBS 2479 / JCM 2466 / KCTC 7840 / NBRC 103889/ NCYC 2677 / UAMH 7654) TaxID=1186058 RepID=J4UH13_TRIAS|nr:hypothetical protein A1Q1_08043 [Trichosporon asahii var. asahii CBS 2479]EJT50830.1 hypothetical protein A1Q1_08043 [Trichosporon asahii var. asahii CBS 2479]
MAEYDYDREGDRDLDLIDEPRASRAHRTRHHSNSRSPVITNGGMDLDRAPSPPRPSVSSRMSLSALVNSPPPPASASPPPVSSRSSRQPALSPPTRSSSRYNDYPSSSRYEPGYMSRSNRSLQSSSDYYGVPRDVGRSYLHRGDHSRADMSYDSPETSRYDRAPSYDTTHEYSTAADPYESRRLRSSGRSSGRRSGGGPGPSSYASYRSPSPPHAPPAFQPYQPSGWRNGGGHDRDLEHEREESPLPPAVSSPVSDRRRSPEPASAPTAAETMPSTAGRKVLRHDDSLEENQDVWQEHLRTFQQRREHEANEILYWTPDLGDGKNVTVKVPTKRKGWPADHPTRIAQRQAKEAALAAGQELPKKKYKRKPKVSSAAIDDELLGLAEGDMVAASSPMPASSVHDGDDDVIPDIDPNALVWPSGLTRAEVIAKIEANDMKGLTEDDVKQVQDEMWLKKNGPAARRKDGTMRKKPGPAKGWKRMRRLAEKAARGENGESEGDESTLNGEADADIAALLDDGSEAPPKKRRQSKKKKSLAADVTVDDIINSEIDEIKADDDANGDVPPPPPPKKRSGKAKEPGVGKGRWTRPPKEKKIKAKEEEAAREEAESVPPPPPPPPRHQPNTYDPRGRQVWSSIIRDVPRVYRVNQAYDNAIKQDAARTAQACQRNLLNSRNLRPSHRSAKSNKDANAKAKRVMREMMVYWRKNEKDEVAARKRAEKEALEKAKAEEEARESKRQARKLNFLLTQTELYSHFIGKKIKTNEAEEMDGGQSTPIPDAPNGVSGNLEDLAAGEEKELDFDDDDEENLRRHAARGALATMQASRDKAREFDKKADEPMDADELDFQNPNLGENQVTITQPKRLMAQLKEYQLKGLTWLGNLYEQGINGILADEMGLGKTIQSISLLAYLAEVHNLWGPFLVIAPSSTLHNWQQELTRFVPHLKALPYWGSPKDRETLRRIWNRKNQTFTEDSPFHILVTSYQLDEKYFQMMRWQYMILDEAQAIKSSSSARWKSLLSFNCRNRLLLTGTPIQNSMHGKLACGFS